MFGKNKKKRLKTYKYAKNKRMEWNKNEFLKEFAYLLQVAGNDVVSSDVKLRYNALSKAIMAEL